VLSQDARLELLIVDDNSPDRTGDIVEEFARTNERVHLMRRPGKMGLGTAYRDGFKWALEREAYEYIFEMDADFSHDPAHLPLFLEAAQRADFVLGSRYLDGNVTVVNWPIRRLLLSYGANVYARVVTGMQLWDATGGFKCFHRRVLAAIDLSDVRSNGYAFQIEMSYRAFRKGFTGIEIPIVFSDRTHGVSKMNKGIVREAVLMVWRLRWWSLTGRL
jgi:dolichol-phosphate mannosyltransferase